MQQQQTYIHAIHRFPDDFFHQSRLQVRRNTVKEVTGQYEQMAVYRTRSISRAMSRIVSLISFTLTNLFIEPIISALFSMHPFILIIAIAEGSQIRKS